MKIEWVINVQWFDLYINGQDMDCAYAPATDKTGIMTWVFDNRFPDLDFPNSDEAKAYLVAQCVLRGEVI